MSNTKNFSASFKMNEWYESQPGLNEKTINIMIDVITNIVNDGSIDISVNSMGQGTIDINNSSLSEDNFKNYLRFFGRRFGFSVLETQTS